MTMPATTTARCVAVLDEIERAVVGKRSALTLILTTVLARGHVLIEDLPGLGKTLIARSFAAALGLDFTRVQFTPDLLPADLLGSTVYDMQSGRFEFRPGPIFTNLLLADEINRTPPKTQAALLEAMAENQVSIDGETHRLPTPFIVLATDNPIEYEGTYPLPEAQLDRFLMKLRLSYPSAEEERVVLQRHHASTGPKGLESISLMAVEAGLLAAAQAEVRGVRIEAGLYDYILAVVRRTREWPSLTLGASPRAAVSLMLVAQGFAALEGRNYLIPDDVKQAALPVLRHRLILKPEAELEGYDTDRVMTEILAAVAVPKQ